MSTANQLKSPKHETKVQMSNDPVCRICFRGKSSENGTPITVCNCQPPFSHVHPKCISDWINATDATTCDICQYQYNIKRRPETMKNWFHSQGKDEEYKISIQTCGMYSFNLLVASILFFATYGEITSNHPVTLTN